MIQSNTQSQWMNLRVSPRPSYPATSRLCPDLTCLTAPYVPPSTTTSARALRPRAKR